MSADSTYSILATVTDRPRSFEVGSHVKTKARLVLDDLPTYDAALAVYADLDLELRLDRFPEIVDLRVRSGADPETHRLTLASDEIRRAARRSLDSYLAAELRATVRYVLRRRSPGTFEATAGRAGESLAKRGLPKPRRVELERALKDACTIGRCHSCGRAWFWPRSEGTLSSVRCSCGERLAQTTLAYGRSFHRLNPAEEEAR